MKRTNDYMESLAKKWQTGEITEQEKTEFDTWYNSFDDTNFQYSSVESLTDLKNRLYSSILQKENIPVHSVKSLFPWKRMVAAASVLLMLSVSGWFALHKRTTPDIAAGGNRAILTLANGKQIILTTAQNGKLADENNASVKKTASGQIVYVVSASQTAAKNADIEFNTIVTPRGGQYWVILADGTRVLLNAASYLRYPTAFTGTDRKVELKGEAYFEVAKDKAHPFIVSTDKQDVEVLGTHFNINSYTDEPATKTTLLEGSVKVTDLQTKQTGMLIPGQQAVLKDHHVVISAANTEEAMAWKNGYFIFESEGITSIMRKVSRWYDVDVVFDGPVPTDKFGGSVNRFANVSQLLDKLELTNKVHFKIEGRRIMVSK
jgi:transmembrane sensor